MKGESAGGFLNRAVGLTEAAGERAVVAVTPTRSGVGRPRGAGDRASRRRTTLDDHLETIAPGGRNHHHRSDPHGLRGTSRGQADPRADNHSCARSAYRDEQWALDMFDFEDTWCASTGEGITVAVVDTGVDAQHPDLVGKVVSQVDLSLDSLLQNSDAGRPGRHGTHVAGTIAAIPNNSIGTAGVAPGVDIIDVKALTAADSIGTQGLVAKAIVHAVDAGAEVINLSVGFPCDQTEDGGFAAADPKIESCALGNGTAALDLAAGYAEANDVVMAVAAGNDGSATVPGDGGEVPNPTHNIWNVPAALDWSLAVGSMGQERRMSVFSTQASYVDIAGPGSDVLSTAFDDEGATWEPMSGTSMATPHVAGLVAVLRGAFPSESAAQIVSRVTGSAAPFGNGDTTDAGDGCPVGTAKAWCFGVGVIDPGASVRWGRT